MYQGVFQTLALDNADAQQAQSNAAFDYYNDQLGWGCDLTRPFRGSRLMYMQTAAAMLQFADNVHRWHMLEGTFMHDHYLAIQKLLLARDDAQAAYDGPAQDLESLGYPYAVNLAGQTVVQQLQAIIDARNAAYDARVLQFDGVNEVFEDGEWDPNDYDRTWVYAVQVLSRWRGWFGSANLHPRKNQYTWVTLQDNTAEVVFFEPVMVGPCRPSEYVDIGCWGGNSNILPYVERFAFGVEWKRDTEYFELDQFERINADTVRDEFNTSLTYYPKLKILKSESVLHCTFIEHPVDIPSTIPYIDVRTVKVTDLETIAGVTETVSYSDLDLRRQPKYLMIYCKSKADCKRKAAFGFTGHLMSDKTASIVEVKLRTDLQPEALHIKGRHHIDALTLRHFPQWEPPIHETGNIFCIAINELPARKNVSIEYNHLYCEIKVRQDWYTSAALEYGVYISLFYGDTFFGIQKNFASGRLDLQ